MPLSKRSNLVCNHQQFNSLSHLSRKKNENDFLAPAFLLDYHLGKITHLNSLLMALGIDDVHFSLLILNCCHIERNCFFLWDWKKKTEKEIGDTKNNLPYYNGYATVTQRTRWGQHYPTHRKSTFWGYELSLHSARGERAGGAVHGAESTAAGQQSRLCCSETLKTTQRDRWMDVEKQADWQSSRWMHLYKIKRDRNTKGKALVDNNLKTHTAVCWSCNTKFQTFRIVNWQWLFWKYLYPI